MTEYQPRYTFDDFFDYVATHWVRTPEEICAQDSPKLSFTPRNTT